MDYIFTKWIDTWEISQRLHNVLKKGQCKNADDVIRRGWVHFVRMPGCGTATLRELTEALRLAGYSWPDEKPDDWKPPPPTVRVRIEVHVDSNGSWVATGGDMNVAFEGIVRTIWVEADVPLPGAQTIIGTVTDD